MKEYKSFYKRVSGNEGGKCRYSTRLDTYGCGCAHDCAYCYAKSLLDFRGLWDAKEPSVADIERIGRRIERLHPGSVVRMGGMTDCFQPIERQYKVTAGAIRLLNKRGVHQLIVTKSDMVAEYMHILDKRLAHVQVSVTFLPFENAVSTDRRIAAIEALQKSGYDVTVRLSPYVPDYVDFDKLNAIQCDKVLVEFLRVNHWIRKWMPMDYSAYTLHQSGYMHMPIERKIMLLDRVRGFEQISVCEDVTEHYDYWREHVNHDKNDCCNLRKE